MLIGIMSDSHGDAAATRRAVSLLVARGAQALFHCGDVCGDGVLTELSGRRAWFVWGNCDNPSPAARGFVVDALGLPWPASPVRVELAGRQIAMYHGHEREFERAMADATVDVVLYGHTHAYRDERIGSVRAINPGALYRARVKTVATLDLLADVLTFLTLDGQVVEV